MNQELETLINLTLEKGSVTEKEKEIILKKAIKLGEDPDEVDMIIDNKLKNLIVKSDKKNSNASILGSITDTLSSDQENVGDTFPVPIWVGWGINGLAWILFVFTFNHTIEIIMGLACCFAAFVGFKHKQIGTPDLLNNNRLSSLNLIYTSVFDAVWMFAWGLGLFGSFNFF